MALCSDTQVQARPPAACLRSAGAEPAARCADCADFRQGVCRGRDRRVPVQVFLACLFLGLIVLGASYYS
jgi:hypothetical protein